MQKFRVFLLLMGLCWFSGQGALLYAQEEEEEDEYAPDGDISVETDWDRYMTDLYSRGDQTFTISMGVTFPVLFYNTNPEIIFSKLVPPVGGAGTLSYTQFLNSRFFIGLEIGINFNRTLAKNTLYIIPIGVRAGWQFILNRFEFPVSLTVGIAPERYVNFSYTGLFIKLGASGFFRFSPEWSFGLNTDWNWYPQRPKENQPDANANIDGHIIGLTLAARYHF